MSISSVTRRGLLAITAALSLTGLAAAQEGYVTNQLVVKYRTANASNSVAANAAPAAESKAAAGRAPQTPKSVIAEIEAQLGATAVSEIPGRSVILLRLPPNLSVTDAMARAKSNPNVVFAEPNFKGGPEETRPNDPDFLQLWGMENVGGAPFFGLRGADIDAPRAWDLITDASSVAVGVIDDNFDSEHVELKPNTWINPGEIAGNSLDDDGNGYVDDVYGICLDGNGNQMPIQVDYHGTHVAGTIGAEGNNGIGVAGVCWKVKLVSANWYYGGTFANAKCIAYFSDLKKAYVASNGASGANIVVTNNSYNHYAYGYSQAMRDSLAASIADDIIHCCSAGNASLDNDVIPHYPSTYGLDMPGVAGLPNVLSIIAMNPDYTKANFSCWGLREAHLGAPGVDTYSTDVNNRYQYLSGTSMATPHVAGAIALLRAYEPSLNLYQVRDRLLNTGDPAESLWGISVTSRTLNLYNLLTNTRPALPIKNLMIRLSVPAGAFRPRQRVPISLSVTDNGTAPVGMSSIPVEIVLPGGGLWRTVVKLDKRGLGSTSYTPSERSGYGTYLVRIPTISLPFTRILPGGNTTAAFTVR